MNSLAEVLGHYQSLLASDPSVWDAMSWTVIVDPADEALLLSRLSDDYVVSDAIDLDALCEAAMAGFDDDDDSPYNARAWLVRTGGSVGLLEVNGWAASLPPTLVPLSRAGASVTNVYWNEAINRCHLSFAQRGIVETVDVIGEDHHDPENLGVLAGPLAAVSSVAGEDEGYEAIGMAVSELVTGLRLDAAILAKMWPVIEFRMREAPQPAAPRNAVGASDPELAIALENATPEARLAAQIQLVARVISLNGLIDEPAVVALVDQLRRGMTPGPSAELFELHARLDAAYPRPASGDIDWSDPVWRRRKAGDTLFAFASPQRAGSAMRFDGWRQASFALEATWPDARAAALRTLRSSGPVAS